MPGIHHAAIVTADVDTSKRFWCDGLGLRELFDYTFTGDWPTLFGAATDQLRSIFLGDPEHPDTALERDVEPTLARLAELGFEEGVRRIEMPAPGGKTVVMAVITAPDGVCVELIGPPG